MIEEERWLLMQEKRQGRDLPRSKKRNSVACGLNAGQRSSGIGEGAKE